MSQPTRIFLSLIAGLALGMAAAALAPQGAIAAADWVQPIGTMWLHALQMTIVPLVVSLLITGVAATAEAAKASRLAGRAFIIFIALLWTSSALGGALTLGFLSAFPLGTGLAEALRNALGSAPPTGEIPPFSAFVVALVPSNPLASAVNDAFLPMILFTTVFAFAITRLPDDERVRLTGFFQAVGNAMLVVINWVLWLGPIGVGALAYVVGARAGTSAFGALLHYVVIVSSVGVVLWLLSVPFAWAFAKVPPTRFVRAIIPSQSVAASTQSSLASLPAMLKSTEALGVPVARAGVVLPLAVALFRWTGPAMNFAVAIYVAHWFGIDLSWGQIAAGWAAAAITTMGAVGLPGTISFVSSIAPIAIAMGVPIAPLGLLVAVETIPDIFRTVGNVAMDVGATRAIAGEGGAESEADELLKAG
ncbi:dicarboxylate/amino acid:cation symporter [Sphingomonas turrisvirgatae]|uniref:Sodium:dicarboxylate symporter n=1 Tax=Sphingomonas turrisvirgatae TaxID=1888892 RepID=A0A1E3LS37_9SPHN|nr:cation:dicarboxylase symporter family transporter [Sphingomonas turrisvirgatae]ODP36005.1 sodium:dicarboxylate symporter [Sphingomonas turrisvirgatae]